MATASSAATFVTFLAVFCVDTRHVSFVLIFLFVCGLGVRMRTRYLVLWCTMRRVWRGAEAMWVGGLEEARLC